MIRQIGHNIFSPLAFSSEENFQLLMQGKSQLCRHEKQWGLPDSFFGSLFDWEKVEVAYSHLPSSKIRLTNFEKIAVLSAYYAISSANIDPKSKDVVFVLSSTKGNVSLLEDLNGYDEERIHLSTSAQLIGEYFDNPNPVIVVSNACTSGVAAQLYAVDLLRTKQYNTAVVVGADVLSKFVVSGFQSFKALSTERCKPFDKNRCGLNLGEGAGTVILQNTEEPQSGDLILAGGGNCNDANHISGPSRTGEGLHNAIEKALKRSDRNNIAFINAHGTATPYNDDMESWAIERSLLSAIPTNSLKGYYGHTLGAAGIIECIISSLSLQNGWILNTLGHEEKGVVKAMTVVSQQQRISHGNSFLKIISGFGGSNAALLYELQK